jgi:hypothetical protein
MRPTIHSQPQEQGQSHRIAFIDVTSISKMGTAKSSGSGEDAKVDAKVKSITRAVKRERRGNAESE